VHEYGPETVYGVMIAISVLMMIVLFSSKYSAAEAFCPPELAAYAWFCTACFVYVIAAYEEVSLTQWMWVRVLCELAREAKQSLACFAL
jgi:hypothetical protein